MAQKKNDMKKPLIILAVVLVAALLAFLIYDEVKTGGYVKELNQAINNTYDLQAGSAVGHTYNYAQDDAENSSEVVRKTDFVRSDDGITFHEQTGNEDGTALVSDVFLRPGEYYYLGEDAKWVRNEIEEGLDTRPYSMSGISREVSSSQYKRVKEVPIPEGFEGDKAYQVVLTRQWIISNYQGDGGEPLDGSIVYVIEYDGETPYVTQVDQLLNIRVTDEEGNKSVQVVEEVSQFTRGTTADGGDVQSALDTFYKENIEGNYVEAADLEAESTDSDAQTEDDLTVGSSGEEMTVGSSEE